MKQDSPRRAINYANVANFVYCQTRLSKQSLEQDSTMESLIWREAYWYNSILSSKSPITLFARYMVEVLQLYVFSLRRKILSLHCWKVEHFTRWIVKYIKNAFSKNKFKAQFKTPPILYKSNPTHFPSLNKANGRRLLKIPLWGSSLRWNIFNSKVVELHSIFANYNSSCNNV